MLRAALMQALAYAELIEQEQISAMSGGISSPVMLTLLHPLHKRQVLLSPSWG